MLGLRSRQHLAKSGPKVTADNARQAGWSSAFSSTLPIWEVHRPPSGRGIRSQPVRTPTLRHAAENRAKNTSCILRHVRQAPSTHIHTVYRKRSLPLSLFIVRQVPWIHYLGQVSREGSPRQACCQRRERPANTKDTPLRMLGLKVTAANLRNLGLGSQQASIGRPRVTARRCIFETTLRGGETVPV
jgi:hypothetical protein